MSIVGCLWVLALDLTFGLAGQAMTTPCYLPQVSQVSRVLKRL